MTRPLTRAQLHEISTDPDFAEQLEKMAERVRVAIFGDDCSLDDALDSLVTSYVEPEDPEELRVYMAMRQQVLELMHEHLRPMVARTLTDGDWRVNDGAR